MDRDLLYPGQIGLVENFLDAFKSSMIGIGITSEAILGQSTQVFGLAATALPSIAVAGSAFAVSIGRGAIFSFQETDPNAYGVLGPDATTSILKTGINLSATEIGIANAAPAAAGYSINYLLSAQFQETDANAVNLPFYNAGGAPTITTENATRTQRVVFQVTGGTMAATGSQTTPPAPAGSVPLYVVTITNGQSAVATGDIAVAPGAPFISTLTTLSALIDILQTGLASEVAARTAEQGNLKTSVGVYATTTLNQSQQGSLVEIYAGSAITLNLPTPVAQAGAVFRILNASAFAQALKTPNGGIFTGPGGNGTAMVTMPPGQLIEAISDNTAWVVSSLGAPAVHYIATQNGTIAAVASTNYTLAEASVSFPAFSRTGAFRVRGRLLAQGSMTGSATSRQNFCSSLSDGTATFFTGASWLVTSAFEGDNWAVSDYFESSGTYAPGASVTFTMSTATAGGAGDFVVSGSLFELFVVEA
jgi:hypothetical protein